MKQESIQELFDQAAIRFSDLPAIECGTLSLSYGELAGRSNRLANFLIASGLTPGTTVAILTEDVVDIVTAIIASLKARCVFVPLDPALPEKRLESLIAEVKPERFVSEARFLDRINSLKGDNAHVVCLSGHEFEGFTDTSNPDLATEPDDMCSIYFTSGSTGRPKGISGRLKGIAHFIKWETRALHLAAGTRVSQLINPTFDAFLRDIFVPLSIGGTVCIPPAEEMLLDPAALVEWLDRQRVNLIHTVPSQFRAIINGGIEPRLFEALQYVLLSGEPLLPADVKRWMTVFGERVQLVNLYGPTETTMTKFFYFVKPSDQNRSFIPIGQPMPGARALLFDERGRLCPPGAIGEIYIRTPFRSLGYWNQPQQTCEVFIQNPFSDDPHDIIYKTGDLGRVLEDGAFQILGRRDQQASQSVEDAEYVAPRDGLEQALVRIWQEVLGRADIGIRDNFFEIGGHSLIATRAVSRIHKQLNARVELRDFFAHPTIEELARFIAELKPAEYVEIAPAPPRALYEVSNAQRRLWVLNQLENEFTAYNICGAYILEGTLNVAAFTRAFAALVARNESLRTTFVQVDGEPMQRIHATEKFPFAVEHTDLRNHADTITTARDIANRDAATVFDLARGPLLKANLLRLEDERYCFVLTMHHIISDGWSMGILVDQVLTCYKAFSHGDENPLPPLRIQYKDFAAWQREQLTGAQLEAYQSYWWKQFSGEVPVLALPADFPRPPVKSYCGDQVTGLLDHGMAQDALKLGQQQGASLFMVLLAAVNALLYRYTFQQDIVVGSPLAGRDRNELEEQIGFYVNTLALRTRPSADDSFSTLLDKVKATTLEAYEHQSYPFDRLVDELHLRRDTSRSPLFDIVVEVQNRELAGSQIPVIEGLTAYNFELENLVSKYDLNFRFWEAQDKLHAQIEYNTDLFKRETVERMLGHLQILFRSAVARPEQPIAKLPMLTEAEQQQLITWNDTRVKRPEGESLHQLFEEQGERSVAQIIEDVAAASPDRTAISFRDKTVTYGELNTTANRLAHFLNTQAALAQDQRVALLMDRSDLMVASILAIWKSGAAYVPIDVNYPADRIRALIGDAEARLILTDSAAAAASLPPETAGLVRLDQRAAEIATQPADNLALPFAPESLAYVIYTSGSTGKPKGVMIEHLGMLNHLFAKIDEFALDSSSVVAQNASHCFDISIWQWFAALLVGGRTVIYDNDTVLNPEAQLQRLAADGVTVFETVPSYLDVMLSVVEEKNMAHEFASLRYMIVNGEVFKPALVRKWFALAPAVKLVNAYGATEVSDDSNHYIMTEAPPYEIIPLGSTLQNLRVYIADEHMNLCPIGVKGEILISGIGVGRGYLNDEERTRRAFSEDPFRQERGVRLYRTGDVGRYLDDGRLEFAGRRDYQVKVRGYRIELEEIEAVVMQHPRVREAMVIDKQDAAGDSYLTCYLAADGETFDVDGLRTFVGEKLPHYMLPSYFKVLPSLPLNENGKHDRKALMLLPDAAENGDRASTAYVAPRDEIEEKLARVWQEVLRLERVGIRDDFFALGGDSFKAIRVVSKFGRGFLVPDLFNNPTIERLADVVRRNGDGNLSLLYELSPKGEHKKVAVVAVPHSAGDPLVYQRTSEALVQLSEEYQFFSVAQPRPEPEPGETFQGTLQQLTKQLLDEIRKIRVPIILYGQSNGSGLTLELARAMEREHLDLRAVCMGGALARLSVDSSTLGIDSRSDDAILRFVNGLGSIVPEDPADLAMFVRNFKYDAIIAVIAYYNALRDMQNGSYAKLEAPLFCVTGDRDPLTRNYQTKYRDWFKFARHVGLVVIDNVGHYLLRDTPEDVARLLHRIGEENFEGVTDDEGRPDGVFTKLRAMFTRG